MTDRLKSAAITRSGQLSPARAKTRHNGRPICGCRNSRSEVLPAHRAARAQNDRISLARRTPSRSAAPYPQADTESRFWFKSDFGSKIFSGSAPPVGGLIASEFHRAAVAGAVKLVS